MGKKLHFTHRSLSVHNTTVIVILSLVILKGKHCYQWKRNNHMHWNNLKSIMIVNIQPLDSWNLHIPLIAELLLCFPMARQRLMVRLNYSCSTSQKTIHYTEVIIIIHTLIGYANGHLVYVSSSPLDSSACASHVQFR